MEAPGDLAQRRAGRTQPRRLLEAGVPACAGRPLAASPRSAGPGRSRRPGAPRRRRPPGSPGRCAWRPRGAVRRRRDGVAEVAQQVPAVRDLDRARGAAADAVGVGAGAVAGDDFDARVRLQPPRQRLGPPVGQQVHNAAPLEVHEDGPVAMAAAPGPIVHRQHARGWRRPGRRPGRLSLGPARHPQQRACSALVGTASRAARRAPATPPARGRGAAAGRPGARSAWPRALPPLRAGARRRSRAGSRG